jgi:hypothetical protein
MTLELPNSRTFDNERERDELQAAVVHQCFVARSSLAEGESVEDGQTALSGPTERRAKIMGSRRTGRGPENGDDKSSRVANGSL